MKILAIRGKNLASLAGEFDIPFTQEPLASAGLFAISGPTGSGKSTLLDALCLALYDDTPRLLKAGGKGVRLPDVAGETVTPDDTSTLLRRGGAEGYAEVDFAGNDGHDYRARWSVRRSKAKADGRLQKSAMTLLRLPELQAVGGTNTEVKAEIVQRIGLSFEQFTRSVLLAQNEFSAFLKADDNERGELLETLTGIVIYTAISKRAFERAKLEQLALARLNDRLADQKPLSADARAELDLESTQANAALLTLELQKNTLDEALRWHEAAGRMQQGIQAAEIALEKSQAEHLAAAPRRSDFERIEAVQDARALLVECERGKADIAQSRLDIALGEADLDQATQAHQAADEAQAQARNLWQDAGQQQVLAAPDLERAKALDTQFETLVPLHRQAAQKNEQAQAAGHDARLAVEDNERQSGLAQEELQKTCDWLVQQAHLERLAGNWPRWDTLLNQATQFARNQARLGDELAAARLDEARLAGLAAARGEESDKAAEAMRLAESNRKTLQAALDGFDVPARLARKQAAEQRRDQLVFAEQLWRDLAGNLSTQSRLEEEAVAQQDAIRQAEAALAQLEELAPAENAALAQAERSLKSAEAACAEKVETLRSALEEQQPCPVCGSPDHPYRSENPQLHAMLDSLTGEVTRCREQVRQSQLQLTSNATLSAGSRRQLDAITQQLHKLQETIQTLQSDWEAHALFGESGDIESDRRASWFAGQQQTVRGQLLALSGEEQAEREAAAARDQAQSEFDRATRIHNGCKEAATVACAALAAARAAGVALEDKHAEAVRSQENTLADLDAAFEHQDWRIGWQQAPEIFHANCKKEVGLWQVKSQAKEAYKVQLGNLTVARVALQDALSRASAEAMRSAAEFASGSTAIDVIRSARNALFGGKATGLVQAELDGAVSAAKQAQDSLCEFTQQCADNQTRLTEARAQANKRLTAQLLCSDDAAAKLTAWIARFNERNPDVPIDLGQLRVLLVRPVEWINNERKSLQEIESNVKNTEILLQERRAQRALHEQIRATVGSADEVTQTLSLLEIERQTAHARAATLQLGIAQDVERRRQSATMLETIEKQEATYRLWAQLSDLIGSADGKKFRNYAQQFTLDVLLGYANQHLAELSRRYRLERIRDTLALMVLDQDMGGELRSVHSLSGGESFLVSLALALGLASLSSNRVRVESLFIDEGFGSLDPETLSVAMDALDGLQAMGRKVGVISHVQEMTERISTKILVQRQAGGKSQVVIV